jgi:hypothetical protein
LSLGNIGRFVHGGANIGTLADTDPDSSFVIADYD